MAHERHADFLQDAGFHKACIEGVTEIVKTHMTDTGVLQGRFPRALHDAEGLAVVLKDQPLGLTVLKQILQ